MDLPMFPLGTVLVPHQLLPLQVFEPRYRALVADCLAGDGRFGVVLIERGSEVGGGDVRFSTGTVARIVDTVTLPGDRIGLAAVGESRLRVQEWLPDDPYPRARVETLVDPPPPPEVVAGHPDLLAAFDRVVELARAGGAPVPDDLGLSADPSRAIWDALAMAPIGPLDTYAALAEDDPGRRLDAVLAALADAAELLELRLR